MDAGFTPASLRAGGATHLLETGVPISNIRFAGCWASEKAMSVYLQEAEAASTLLSMSGSSVDRLEFAPVICVLLKDLPAALYLSCLMDPQHAFDFMDVAALFSVQLAAQERMHLYQLSSTDIAEIEASKQNSDQVRLSKKYVLAEEALERLGEVIEGYPASSVSEPEPPPLQAGSLKVSFSGTSHRPKHLVPSQPANCALFPFVRVAPARPALLLQNLSMGPLFRY